jgi:2-C-methyl-D-erythritol 4-phosphate cytidylyltransferase
MAAEPWVVSSGARVVAGGTRRQDSVAAGVAEATSDIVLVHDGARPLVSAALVDRVAQATVESGAALPAWPVV